MKKLRLIICIALLVFLCSSCDYIKDEKSNVSDNIYMISYSDNGRILRRYDLAGNIKAEFEESFDISKALRYNNKIFYTVQTENEIDDRFLLCSINQNLKETTREVIAEHVEASILVDGDFLYFWTKGKGIFKYDIKAGKTNMVLELKYDIYDFDIKDDVLYYSTFDYENKDETGLYIYNIKDKSNTPIAKGAFYSIEGIVNDNCIYHYDNEFEHELFLYDYKSNKSISLDLNDYIMASTLKDGIYYYANLDNPYNLYSLNLETLDKQLLIKDIITNVKIDGEWLYYNTKESNYRNFNRYNLNTGFIEKMAHSLSGEIITFYNTK